MSPGKNTSLPFSSIYAIFKWLLIKLCKDFNKGRYVATNVARLDLLIDLFMFSITILFIKVSQYLFKQNKSTLKT